MNLRRSMIATVLTAAVILAMAFLPFCLSALQDRFSHRDYAYADISAVELKMDNSSIWNRIMLLSAGADSYEISTEQASIERDKLPSHIEAGLKPFIDRGVLPYTPDYASDINEVQCHMVYAKNNSASGAVFWLVVLVDEATGDIIELLLDDRSGKIVMLNFTTNDYFGRTVYHPNELIHLYLYTYLEEIGDAEQQTEVLEVTTTGGLYHTVVIVQHPEINGSLNLSFLTDSNGLNMVVSADYAAEYDRSDS